MTSGNWRFLFSFHGYSIGTFYDGEKGRSVAIGEIEVVETWSIQEPSQAFQVCHLKRNWPVNETELISIQLKIQYPHVRNLWSTCEAERSTTGGRFYKPFYKPFYTPFYKPFSCDVTTNTSLYLLIPRVLQGPAGSWSDTHHFARSGYDQNHDTTRVQKPIVFNY